jgi:hypothetical protein
MSSQVQIFAGEEAVMAEARAWPWEQMDEAVLPCAEAVLSNSPQCKLHLMPAQVGKAMTSSDVEALLGTTEAHPATLKATGETNPLKANHHKTNKVQWAISKAKGSPKVASNPDTATVAL